MVFPKEIFRQSPGLLSEEEVDRVAVFHLGICSRRLCRKKIKFRAGVLCKEIGKSVVIGDIQQIPIIKPSAFQFFIVHFESHGFDKMQPRAGGGAGAGDIARVLRYFRFHQHDIDVCHDSVSRVLFVFIINPAPPDFKRKVRRGIK